MGQPEAAPNSDTSAVAAAEIESLFNEGIAFHRAGLLPEAERQYRRVLEACPQHFDSLHLLGVISYQRGEFAQAVRQIDFALRVNPHVSDAHNNLGNALKRLGQFREGPWYPSARLYRQRVRNNWAPVVSEVGQALSALLTRRR